MSILLLFTFFIEKHSEDDIWSVFKEKDEQDLKNI